MAIRKDQAGVLTSNDEDFLNKLDEYVSLRLDNQYTQGSTRQIIVTFEEMKKHILGSDSRNKPDLALKIYRALKKRFEEAGWNVQETSGDFRFS